MDGHGYRLDLRAPTSDLHLYLSVPADWHPGGLHRSLARDLVVVRRPVCVASSPVVCHYWCVTHHAFMHVGIIVCVVIDPIILFVRCRTLTHNGACPVELSSGGSYLQNHDTKERFCPD